MESNKRISEIVVETGAYTDLDEPVILASGALGIYYVNAEKLCQDGGKFKEYGDDSASMIQHAVKMMEEHPTFEEVIDILAEKVEDIFKGNKTKNIISGGQRRDWIFSGPVAHKLGLPHLSLYKQEEGEEDKTEIIMPDGMKSITPPLEGFYDVHLVDLITEASSCYSEDGKKGWIKMIRNKGADIDNLLAVVTRLQKGEERLAGLNPPVNTTTYVAIDEDFVKTYSKDPERALEYQAGPDKWAERYIEEKGIDALIKFFDPKGGKLDRAKLFLNRYEKVLHESGQGALLGLEVSEEYGREAEKLFEERGD